MTDRAARIDAFLASAGWGGATRRPLESDASFRRYTFLGDDARRALLMDAPPDKEDVRPYLRIARHLTGLGYSAPRILAEDTAAGLLVIEDLGEDTYTRLLTPRVASSSLAEQGQADDGHPRDGGSLEDRLYALAVDVLIDLHRRPPAEAIPPDLPAYDEATLLREALLFTDWYLPAATGRPVEPALRDAYVAAWRAVLPPVLGGDGSRPTLVLRDYHVDNLLLVPGRPGVAACGLLDFQDALAGHPAYDVVSLLEDARRDVGDDLAARMRARYAAAFPGDVPGFHGAFDAAYAILGAQRHMKVLGIFVRLSRRDGKPRYLVHLPRLWRLLERALRHPALAPVATWLDGNVPAALRGPLRHEVAA